MKESNNTIIYGANNMITTALGDEFDPVDGAPICRSCWLRSWTRGGYEEKIGELLVVVTYIISIMAIITFSVTRKRRLASNMAHYLAATP
jgi:hypothetical protein